MWEPGQSCKLSGQSEAPDDFMPWDSEARRQPWCMSSPGVVGPGVIWHLVETVIAATSTWDGVLADFVFPVSWPSGVSSIYSFKEYLLRAYSEPGILLDGGDTEVNKTDIVPGIVYKNNHKFLSLHLGQGDVAGPSS